MNRDLLKRGAVLVDDKDFGVTPRVLCILEHGVQDASLLPTGERRTVSRRMLYVELDAAGKASHLHYAPYLDYRPLMPDEPTGAELLARPEGAWISSDIEQKAQVVRDRRGRSWSCRGDSNPPDRLGGEDAGRGERPADEGDRALGPSRGAVEAAGGSGQARRPLELPGGETPRRRPARAAEAPPRRTRS